MGGPHKLTHKTMSSGCQAELGRGADKVIVITNGPNFKLSVLTTLQASPSGILCSWTTRVGVWESARPPDLLYVCIVQMLQEFAPFL